jgi:hypothetical protein
MGQREDRAIGDALPQLGWLSEVIGHKYGLAVPWHQRMDRAEQHGGSHRSEYGPEVAASDLTEATRHPSIEPMLNRHQAVHCFAEWS